jgi:hypothetical protein
VAKSRTNFYWHGTDGEPARWFFEGDDVPAAVAKAVDPVHTGRAIEAASEPDLGPPVPPPSERAAEATQDAPEGSSSQDDVTVEVPPRRGPGSGREAWLAYADSVGVTVEDDAKVADIVAAIEGAGHPVERSE